MCYEVGGGFMWGGVIYWWRFRMMGIEEILWYLFTVRSVPIKILQCVLASSLPVSDPGTILDVLGCQMCHSWVVSYLSLPEKGSTTVVTMPALFGTCFYGNCVDLLAFPVPSYHLFHLCKASYVTQDAASPTVPPWMLASSDSLKGHCCVSLMTITNASLTEYARKCKW